jgi:LemA protein
MSGTMLVLIVIGSIALGAILIYNRFIKRQNVVMEAWSGIDVQLKRRHNLIPNLIETVKGYSGHEKKVLTELTELRTGSQQAAERGEQETQISQAIRNLLVVAEQYPDLKASQNFLDLQDNLDQIETEIQQARRFYNGSVRDLNILVESFPSNLIAKVFGFHVAEFFELDPAVPRTVPEVKF